MRFFSAKAWKEFEQRLTDLRAENVVLQQTNKELTHKLMALVDARALHVAESFTVPPRPELYIGTGHDEIQQYDEFGMPMWVTVSE